ncbi:MAG: hypothetical protein Q9M91_03655 [Candidatus Dojkabacteria bacterium]|nr:hypothetical protein [Candidatus Dojkabacteria bacterium]MDQ7020912.1 hypothetical protein [Candidatus Dojkabacteria bacterium]
MAELPEDNDNVRVIKSEEVTYEIALDAFNAREKFARSNLSNYLGIDEDELILRKKWNQVLALSIQIVIRFYIRFTYLLKQFYIKYQACK